MYHTTKEGKTMLIACMNDNHLTNTINVHLNKIAYMQKTLSSPTIVNNVSLIAAGYKQPSIQDIQYEIKNIVAIIQPYCLEAMIRGLDWCSKMQEAFGRKEMIVMPGDVVLALGHDEYEYLPNYDNE